MGNASFGRIQLRGKADTDEEQARGKRHHLTYEDDNGQRVVLTQFNDMEDMQTFMALRDSEGRSLYETDAAFRQSIKEVAANSPGLFQEKSLARRSPLPGNKEMLAGLREDALRQKRDRLVEAAAGGDLVAKYQLAEALMNPESFEAAHEMQAATEVSRPIENMLKSRRQRGLGPMKYNEPLATDTESAQREHAHNQEILSDLGNADITIGGK